MLLENNIIQKFEDCLGIKLRYVSEEDAIAGRGYIKLLEDECFVLVKMFRNNKTISIDYLLGVSLSSDFGIGTASLIRKFNESINNAFDGVQFYKENVNNSIVLYVYKQDSIDAVFQVEEKILNSVNLFISKIKVESDSIAEIFSSAATESVLFSFLR